MGRLAVVALLVALAAPSAVAQVARPICFSSAATIVGSNEDDKIQGTAGPDVIVSLDGNDVIAAGEGDDKICSGKGNDVVLAASGRDSIDGGDGNDRLDGGEGADGLVGGPGDDQLVGRPDDSDFAAYVFAPGPVQADLSTGIVTGEGRDTLTNIESLIGSKFDDKLVGDSEFNFLAGLGGNDELVGGDGFDAASFVKPVNASLATGEARGEGVDKLTGFEALVGSDDGPNRLTGDGKPNILLGGASHDSLSGGGGIDFLVGTDGSDRLDGGAGSDTLFGGAGRDLLNGGPGTSDTASYVLSTTAVRANLARKRSTGEGSDVLRGVESLAGSQLDDELTGDANANELFGNDGDDLLAGGGGSDFLGGGAGNDTLHPGAGRDYCLDDRRVPGCEIFGVPVIPGAPAQPPLPAGPRRVQGGRVSSSSPARPAGGQIALLSWRARVAGSLTGTGPLADRPSTPGAVRETAGFEYSAEPVCISTGGRRLTEIAPPKVVGPVGDDGQHEVAWWQGTLLRQGRNPRQFSIQAQTAWAQAQLAGGFVLPGVVAWKISGERAFPSPFVVHVPKGKYVWRGEIYWVRSGGKIFEPVEPHIIRAKTIQHRQGCDFTR